MIMLLKAGLFQSSDKFKEAKQTLRRYSNKYEIELYVDGEGESVVDNVSYPHQKGRLLFVGPGITRYSKNKFVCYYVHLIPDEETSLLLKSVATSFIVSKYKLLEDAFKEVIRLSDGEGNDLLLQSRLYELLHIIIGESKGGGQTLQIKPGGNRVIQKALSYMDENYTEEITLKEIAEYMSFSPVYFHNVFKDYMGITPHAYIEKKRIDAAKDYLLTGELSLEEIAVRCGFKSHSYFAYCFKRSEGISPTAFRKKDNKYKGANL